MPRTSSAPIPWIAGFLFAIVLVVAGWMLFDGIRALTTGTYFSFGEGASAGTLGPWAGLVEAVGIDPESTAMKFVFVAYGAIYLWVAFAYLRRYRWARTALTVVAILGLWYLPFGTALNAGVLVLMYLTPLKPWFEGKAPAAARPA